MLAAAAGKSVVLWDVTSKQKLASLLSGTRDRVFTVVFSPDGKHLAWGSGSVAPSPDLLVTWSASLDAWRQDACRLANRNFTPEEWTRFAGEGVNHQVLCPGAR